jgi:hypothetical protein
LLIRTTMSVIMKAICAEEMDITNQHLNPCKYTHTHIYIYDVYVSIILIYNELPFNQFFIYVQICMPCSHHIIDNMPHLL